MNNAIILRHQMLRAIRAHFDDHGFIEVQTPVRIPAPALEDYIDAIPSPPAWLRTSPELHMKRLLARGHERIYQIGPCFRAGEHGSRHRNEFCMLEWYQAHANYRDLIPFTTELIRRAATAVSSDLDLDGDWEILTVDQAFLRHTDSPATEACRCDTFDELLVNCVEPHLGSEKPTFLIDYPANLGALARLSSTNPEVAERWELYIRGLELANAYSELTDPVEQRQRFHQTAQLRHRDGREVYPIDEDFMTALAHMPNAAGAALGIDRLLMAISRIHDIGNAISFPEKIEDTPAAQ